MDNDYVFSKLFFSCWVIIEQMLLIVVVFLWCQKMDKQIDIDLQLLHYMTYEPSRA